MKTGHENLKKSLQQQQRASYRRQYGEVDLRRETLEDLAIFNLLRAEESDGCDYYDRC